VLRAGSSEGGSDRNTSIGGIDRRQEIDDDEFRLELWSRLESTLNKDSEEMTDGAELDRRRIGAYMRLVAPEAASHQSSGGATGVLR
jgi:hypothetical protein